MPEFDLDSALETLPFTVVESEFSSGETLYYLQFAPEDGSEPFNATWFHRRSEADTFCHRANRKHATSPYPYRRSYGGTVLRLPSFIEWLRP